VRFTWIRGAEIGILGRETRTESSQSSRPVTFLGSWDKGLLESDGLPTAAFLHVDAREHNLALGIFSRHRSCDISLTANHRGVATALP
jgi:hypothetical protein